MSEDAVVAVLFLSVLGLIFGLGGRQAWQANRRAPVPAGWRPLPDDPGLLVRLGLSDGFARGDHRATDVRVREVEGFSVLAAHVPERTTMRRWGSYGSDGTYTLCALTMPVPLPVLDLHPARSSARGSSRDESPAARLLRLRHGFAPSDWWAQTLDRPAVIAAIGSGPLEAGLQVVGSQLVSTRRGPLDPVEVDVRIAWLVRIAHALTVGTPSDASPA